MQDLCSYSRLVEGLPLWSKIHLLLYLTGHGQTGALPGVFPYWIPPWIPNYRITNLKQNKDVLSSTLCVVPKATGVITSSWQAAAQAKQALHNHDVRVSYVLLFMMQT